MPLIEIEAPTPAALRWFGLPFALAVTLLAVLLATRGVGRGAITIVVASAATFVSLYYAIPAFRRPIYLAWIYAAYPLGFVVAHLVMVAIYFLVITPLGLFSRLAGRRRLARRFDPKADSYWQPRPPRDDPSSYFEQY